MPQLLSVETTVGERVYLARTRSGNYNAKAFYEGMGLNRDRMSRIERGLEEPRFSDLAAISARTGAPLDWLEGGHESEAHAVWRGYGWRIRGPERRRAPAR